MFAHRTKTTALRQNTGALIGGEQPKNPVRRREVHKDSVEPLEADMLGERPR